MKTNKPNYKRFVLQRERWDKIGMPYGLRDLIDLAVKYNTPIPIKPLNGLFSKEEIEMFNKERGVENYETD